MEYPRENEDFSNPEIKAHKFGKQNLFKNTVRIKTIN